MTSRLNVPRTGAPLAQASGPTGTQRAASPAGRRLAAIILAAGLLLLGIAAGNPDRAAAASYTWCYSSGVPQNTFCPWHDVAAGERHTYKDQFINWGTTVHSGCHVSLWSSMWVAYVSSNASYPKYELYACNSGYQAFPANSQLLRGYSYQSNVSSAFLWGNGAY